MNLNIFFLLFLFSSTNFRANLCIYFFIKYNPSAYRSLDLILERLCIEGSRRQAKYSVYALASITKDDGLMALSVLYKVSLPFLCFNLSIIFSCSYMSLLLQFVHSFCFCFCQM